MTNVVEDFPTARRIEWSKVLASEVHTLILPEQLVYSLSPKMVIMGCLSFDVFQVEE